MNTHITQKIIEVGASLGACDLIHKCGGDRELVDLLFTGQGREFCTAHKFPTPELARQMYNRDNRLYIDAGKVALINSPEVVLMGETEGNILINDPSQVHKLVLMHGAKAVIHISAYCMLVITRIGNGTHAHYESKHSTSSIIED